VRWADVVILLGRMTASLPFERELARREVPYYVVAGTGFFNQQEVYDVLNALRAIDNPFDDVAFFGVLRGGMFGLSDDALLRIADAMDPPYLPGLQSAGTAAVSDLPPADAAALAAAVDLLTRLHARKDAVGIDALIDEVLAATGYEAVLLAQFQGRRLAGNVRRLTELARAATADRLPLADFVRQMDERRIDQSRFEQAAVAGEAEDVVRLMTVHKAKGLEFPVVVLPDLNRQRKGVDSNLLHRRDWGLTFNLPAGREDEDEAENGEAIDTRARAKADRPISYEAARRREQQAQEAEDVRQLYVAATRHRDHLVFVWADWRDKDGRFGQNGCELARLDEALGIRRALEAGRETIPYENGRYAAAVRRVRPEAPPPSGQRPPGRRVLQAAVSAEDVARGLADMAAETGAAEMGTGSFFVSGISTPGPAHAAKKTSVPISAPPLLGPLPADVGTVDLAVTALSDFALCPRLYQWRHELRMPASEPQPTSRDRKAARAFEGPVPPPSSAWGSLDEHTSKPQTSRGLPVAHSTGLDPLTLGTLLHKCMELLDPAEPQPAAHVLLARAAAAAGIELPLRHAQGEPAEPARAELVGQLEAILQTFAASDLAAALRDARQTFRELDFVLELGPARLRGQIDLLHQDAAGRWHVVDYKSDRLDGESAAAHSRRYELQVLLYAAAAERHFGQRPADARLYYLRNGQTHDFDTTAEAIAAARERAADLARSLIAARRGKEFTPRRGDPCGACPYDALCARMRTDAARAQA